MNVKKNLFENKMLIQSDKYLTDKFILLSLNTPLFTGLEKITKNMPINNDLNDQVKPLLKPLSDLQNITPNFTGINPVYKYDKYFKTIKLELLNQKLSENINIKLQLKYYDFLMELLKENNSLKLFTDKKYKNSPLFIYKDNNLIMVLMPLSK